mgnify:CR=1 FL=1
MVTEDGEIFFIDLPDTQDISEDIDTSEEAETDSKETSKTNDNLSKDDNKPAKEKKKKSKKEKKVKKDKKEKKEKKNSTSKAVDTEMPKPQGATPERNMDRTGMFIVDWLKKLFAKEILPKNYAEILKDLFLLPNSRSYFLRFLGQKVKESKGNVIDIGREPFEQFIKLSGVFILAAENSQDFRSIAVFVPYFKLFKSISEPNQNYMYRGLADLKVWRNDEIWTLLLQLTLEMDSEKSEDSKSSALNKVVGHLQQLQVPKPQIEEFVTTQGKTLSLSADYTSSICNNIKDVEPLTVAASSPAASPCPGRLSRNSSPVPSGTAANSSSFTITDSLIGHKKKGAVTSISLHYPRVLSGSATGNCFFYDLDTRTYSDFQIPSHEKEISDCIVTLEFIITASFDGVRSHSRSNILLIRNST